MPIAHDPREKFHGYPDYLKYNAYNFIELPDKREANSAASAKGERETRSPRPARKFNMSNAIPSRKTLDRAGIPHADLLKMPYSTHLSAVVINVIGLLLPLSILLVYDRIIPNNGTNTLASLIFILVLASAFEACLKILRSYVIGRSAAHFSHNIAVEALKVILSRNSGQIMHAAPSKTLDKLDAITRLGSFFGGPARQVIVDVPFAMIFLATIYIIGGVLVLIPISILLVFGIATIVYGGALGKSLSLKDEQDSKVFDFISETLAGISTVKGHAMESQMMRRFERLAEGSANLIQGTVLATERSQILAGALGNATTISMASIGAVFAVQGTITVGTLAACSMLSGRAVQPILRVAGMWNEFQRAKIAVSDAEEIFAMAAEDLSTPEESILVPPEITLTDASYFYEDTDRGWKDVNMTIAAGDLVSLCGPSGIGKSTLLKLIAGQLEPQTGAVEIAGMPATQFRQAYTNSISIVTPQSSAFQGSILENLTLFGGGCSADEALAAARAMGIEQDIYRFPDGYDTEIGGAATEALPIGLVQRILIARALAQRSALLILDEAQAFLDPRSDAILMEALRDLRTQSTVVLVTNRPEYLAMSDKVFDLAPGIVELRRSSAQPARVREAS